MKFPVFLAAAALIALGGCVAQHEYSSASSPLYAFENFRDAVSIKDEAFAWGCISAEMKAKEFGGDSSKFKAWIASGDKKLGELLGAEYYSELIIEQNVEMLLRMKEGDIRFVKEGQEWKMDSFLLPRQS